MRTRTTTTTRTKQSFCCRSLCTCALGASQDLRNHNTTANVIIRIWCTVKKCLFNCVAFSSTKPHYHKHKHKHSVTQSQFSRKLDRILITNERTFLLRCALSGRSHIEMYLNRFLCWSRLRGTTIAQQDPRTPTRHSIIVIQIQNHMQCIRIYVNLWHEHIIQRMHTKPASNTKG